MGINSKSELKTTGMSLLLKLQVVITPVFSDLLMTIILITGSLEMFS